MLKRINNDIDHIRLDEASDAAYEAYLACMSNRQSAINSAQDEIDDCVTEIAKIDEALSKIEENTKRLGEITDAYKDVQNDINNCWTSDTKINGFETMQADIDCINNFCANMENEKTTLENSKTDWETKKTNAETDKANAEAITC